MQIKELNEALEQIFNEADIEVKNSGILEVPEGKKFWQLPLSHYEDLVKRKGYGKIIRALTNLKTWNKNDDKDISSKADSIADKLRKKFRKDESNESVSVGDKVITKWDTSIPKRIGTITKIISDDVAEVEFEAKGNLLGRTDRFYIDDLIIV